MYDKKVKVVLEKSGWYEGRKLDISEKLSKLEECGCVAFDKAIEFLQEFDELKISELPCFYDSSKDERHHCHIFDINIMIKFLISQPKEERKKICERIFNNTNSTERTIWIGRMAGGEMELFITESGKIVTDIFIIGNTIEEGVSNLITRDNCGFLDEKMRELYQK